YVSLERFDDYWKGKPKLAEVMIKVIDPSLTIGALQNGEVNLMEIRPDDVEELEKFDHIQIEEHAGLGYSYVAFRFGHYDKDGGTAVAYVDIDVKKEVRRAMFDALDRASLVISDVAGKATIVNTPMPPVHVSEADEAELTQY